MYKTAVIIFLLSAASVFAGDKYIDYALRVAEFDTAGYIVTAYGDGEVNFKNSGGDILRFRVNDKGGLMKYHAGIAFIYFDFEDGWIKKYKTYDKLGILKGDEESGDLAVVEYRIEKMNLLHAKFEVLDAADGNIEMKDAQEEIVYMKAYDSKYGLIKENYISTKEYWNANNVMYRP